jgi:hypothetical protein
VLVHGGHSPGHKGSRRQIAAPGEEKACMNSRRVTGAAFIADASPFRQYEVSPPKHVRSFNEILFTLLQPLAEPASAQQTSSWSRHSLRTRVDGSPHR